jgi:dihydroflavonol-4-reductase
MSVLVTGATGLVGSVICQELRRAGGDVHALVRPQSDASALQEMGVKVKRGDVRDVESIRLAADGCDIAVHSAALIGTATQDLAEQREVNLNGAINLFDVAVEQRMRRVVALSTYSFLDQSATLTEHSPIADPPPTDPYSVSKYEAFEEALRRAGEGQDIVVVTVGAVYGPSPNVARALEPPGSNPRILWALRKEVDNYPSFPVCWVYTEDIARCAIAAAGRGVAGERYLGFGHPDDAHPIADLMTRACEIVGVDHRVRALTGAELDDPTALALHGPTLIGLAKRRFATPLFDHRFTCQRLGYEPRRLDVGLRATIEWLDANGLVPHA